MRPDAEKIVSGYLREHADIAALGARVVGKTPSSTTIAWVRVIQLDSGDQPNSRADHLIDHLLQLDCYAGQNGGQPEANLLARTVAAALVGMPDSDFDDAVVSSARVRIGPRLADQDFEPARERVIVEATVHMHALEAVS